MPAGGIMRTFRRAEAARHCQGQRTSATPPRAQGRHRRVIPDPAAGHLRAQCHGRLARRRLSGDFSRSATCTGSVRNPCRDCQKAGTIVGAVRGFVPGLPFGVLIAFSTIGCCLSAISIRSNDTTRQSAGRPEAMDIRAAAAIGLGQAGNRAHTIDTVPVPGRDG